MANLDKKPSQARKLAAILFVDMVGYTAIMQSDEALGRRNLKVFHKTLEKYTNQFKGKVINNYGDGCLCTFDSALDAIQCAKSLQTIFLNDSPIQVRIGLHMGDVFFESENAYGDSVNLASRIESLGVAGAVLFSRKIRDEIKNQPDLKFKSLGSFAFKHVDEPMQVFALSEPGFTIPSRKDIQGKLKSSNNKSNRLTYVLVLVITVIIVGFIAWISQSTSSTSDPLNAAETAQDLSVESDANLSWSDIIGVWDIYFFYDNDSSIVYNGTLEISGTDSLTAVFEILTPRSRRSEKVKTKSVTFSPNRKKLIGTLVHDMYKIRGGFLEEAFEFDFEENLQKFSGTGKCVAYCAEGTENATILWQGSKGGVE